MKFLMRRRPKEVERWRAGGEWGEGAGGDARGGSVEGEQTRTLCTQSSVRGDGWLSW